MTTHHMKLSKEPFEKIASGQKIIESRIYDEKRQQINVGDCVELMRNDDPTKTILTKVKALYCYSSFDDLFSSFPLEYFGSDSREELIREIKKFYSEKEVRQYGVVGIKIELL